MRTFNRFVQGNLRFSESMRIFVEQNHRTTQPQAVPWLSHALNACNWSLEAATVTGGKKKSSHDVSQKFGSLPKNPIKMLNLSNKPTWTVQTHKKNSLDQTRRMVECTPLLSILMTIFEPQKNQSSNPRDFRHAICVVESCFNLRFFSKGALPRTPSECLLEVVDSSHLFMGIHPLVN